MMDSAYTFDMVSSSNSSPRNNSTNNSSHYCRSRDERLASHRRVTQTSLLLAILTFLLFGTLALIFSFNDSSSSPTESSSVVSSLSTTIGRNRRRLDESDSDVDGNTYDDDDDSFASYSCNRIFSVVPEAGDEQCQFARKCNQGAGLWAPFVFCSKTFSSGFLVTCISPIIIVWTVVLFRMLSSTAEDFFSPSLEMFAMKLGLPPRFAGVTLLALGNGAADVSATTSAIVNDPVQGYKLSLGALTGGAMVISGIVSSLVVFAADGVPCRGALVRDVTMLLLTVVFVWKELASGSVGPEGVSFFLTLYMAFVLLVLAADVYHRAVFVPRQRTEAQRREVRRQLNQQRQSQDLLTPDDVVGGGRDGLLREDTPADGIHRYSNGNGANGGDIRQEEESTMASPPPRRNRFQRFITALSNYDSASQSFDDVSLANTGVESDYLDQDRPMMLHGSHGILHGGSGGGGAPTTTTAPVGGQTKPSAASANGDALAGGPSLDAAYTMLEDSTYNACVEPGSGIGSSVGWTEALNEGKEELIRHASEVWEDIVWNGDIGTVTKIFLLLELPYTILRKTTVPIPCEGYYVRALVALATAMSPAWMAFYAWYGHEAGIFKSGAWIYITIIWIFMCIVGLAILRYAPAGNEANMSILVSTPIALYGFAVAATWIDTIASSLVSVLSFVGIALRIPGPVVGLSILAWGNSMGDASANVIMARKGLANMAMTACFAGPVFNILVGMGIGFGRLHASTGNKVTRVTLSPSVLVGFVFLCLTAFTVIFMGLGYGRGMIRKEFAYAAISLYGVYLICAILLQFSKYADDDDDDE